MSAAREKFDCVCLLESRRVVEGPFSVEQLEKATNLDAKGSFCARLTSEELQLQATKNHSRLLSKRSGWRNKPYYRTVEIRRKAGIF